MLKYFENAFIIVLILGFPLLTYDWYLATPWLTFPIAYVVGLFVFTLVTAVFLQSTALRGVRYHLIQGSAVCVYLVVFPILYVFVKDKFCRNFGCEHETRVQQGDVRVVVHIHEVPIGFDGVEYVHSLYKANKLIGSCECSRDSMSCIKQEAKKLIINCGHERHEATFD